MFIKRIIDHDKLSGEMDLIVSDGKYELLCYCFQSNAPTQWKIKELKTFLADKIMIAHNNNYLIDKTGGYYSYHLQGKVLEINPPKVEIGKMCIVIDTQFPKDINQNSFIEFFVERIDCMLY